MNFKIIIEKIKNLFSSSDKENYFNLPSIIFTLIFIITSSFFYKNASDVSYLTEEISYIEEKKPDIYNDYITSNNITTFDELLDYVLDNPMDFIMNNIHSLEDITRIFPNVKDQAYVLRYLVMSYNELVYSDYITNNNITNFDELVAYVLNNPMDYIMNNIHSLEDIARIFPDKKDQDYILTHITKAINEFAIKDDYNNITNFDDLLAYVLKNPMDFVMNHIHSLEDITRIFPNIRDQIYVLQYFVMSSTDLADIVTPINYNDITTFDELVAYALNNPMDYIMNNIHSLEDIARIFPDKKDQVYILRHILMSVSEEELFDIIMQLYYEKKIITESTDQGATIWTSYIPLIFTVISLILIVFLSSLVVWKNKDNVVKFNLNKQLTRALLPLTGYIIYISYILVSNLNNRLDKLDLIYYGNENILVHNIICLLFILFFVYCYDYLKNHSSEISIEFPILFLMSYLGMLILISTKEIFIWFIALELMSFSFYTLAGYRSKRFFLQTEGSLKYFIIGSIASSLFIFGLSIVYISYGTVDFNNLLALIYFSGNNGIGYFGILLILIAISFKLGIAPFHLWVPEVYYSSTSIITFFFLLIPKVSLVYLLNLFAMINFDMNYTSYFFIIYFLTFLMGTLSAIRQTSLDKFLAYSAVANNAWFILVIAIGGNDSFLWFYIFVYSMITILLYAPISLMRKADNSRLLINLRDLLVLKKTNPWIAVFFSMAFFSLAGIPPFLGFFSKFFLILASIDKAYYSWTIIAIIFSVFSCYYYIRMIKIIYFSNLLKFSYQKPISLASSLIISILTAINIFFLMSPKTLILLFYFI